MKYTILANLGMFFWVLGILLMMLSNASRIIKATDYKRTGWKKYRMGYSISEIKEVIELVDDTKIEGKLKRKIIYRRFSILLLISTPILIFIANK